MQAGEIGGFAACVVDCSVRLFKAGRPFLVRVAYMEG